MNSSLSLYCERINNAAEPVNVISNLGFMVVSLTLIYLLWRHKNQSSKPPTVSRMLWIVSLLPLLIGLGSAAYHYSPSNLTLFLDLAPIGLFAAGSLFLSLQHIAGYSRTQAGNYLKIWILATAIAAPWPGYFFGSLIYVPTSIALLLVATKTRDHLILIESILFFLALLMRSLDLPSCDILTTGTHPFWHLLAAIVSMLILMALQRAMQTQPCNQSHQPLQSRTN